MLSLIPELSGFSAPLWPEPLLWHGPKTKGDENHNHSAPFSSVTEFGGRQGDGGTRAYKLMTIHRIDKVQLQALDLPCLGLNWLSLILALHQWSSIFLQWSYSFYTNGKDRSIEPKELMDLFSKLSLSFIILLTTKHETMKLWIFILTKMEAYVVRY